MKKKALRVFLTVLIMTPATASSSDSIPNANMRVMVQQKEQEKINKGFHVLELSCWDGQCSLSSVSVNPCVESGSGKKAFYPKVQYPATSMGNLKVRNEGNSLIVQETGSDISSDYMNNLRFDYKPVGKQYS